MAIVDLAKERAKRPTNRAMLEHAARLRVRAAALNRMIDEMKLKASDLERRATGQTRE